MILYNLTKNCNKCQKNKINKYKYGKIHGHLSSTDLNEKIFIDHLGPFIESDLIKSTNDNKFWLVVITEAFSKFTKIYKAETLKPEHTVRSLKKYLQLFKKPNTIITDNGKTFISKYFKNYINSLNIKHVLISAYNPESNGLVERRNRIILEILKIYNFNSIKKYIQKAELKLNYVSNCLTHYMPSQLMLNTNKFDLIHKDDYKHIEESAKHKIIKMNYNYNKNMNQKKNKSHI